jgi:hypothetical protein
LGNRQFEKANQGETLAVQEQTHIIGRGITEDLTARLTPEEFSSLQEIADGLMQPVIPAQHRDRLVALGYIVDRTGSPDLTPAGLMRLKAGR